MIEIKLSNLELKLLLTQVLKDEPKKKFSINFSEDDVEKIHDLIGNRLQEIGFDENYELTTEGIILEDLIDKFLID